MLRTLPRLTIASLLLIALYLSGVAGAADQPAPVRAILVIDDMGNGLDLGQRALALPGKINYAFLPHSPNGRALAESAHRRGKEVLLHLPMSTIDQRNSGPGSLRAIMDRQQFLATLADNLADIPHVRGVNNHMGSLLTQLRQPMDWLMHALKQQQLYFLDSRTSPLTVAERSARHQQLPTLRRDIFLDNQRDPAAMQAQFNRWLELAHRRGNALAIAHPHPETLAFLEQQLPTLEDQGITLTLISEWLHSPAPAPLQFAEQ